jgi:hypothetical protein
MDLAEPLAAGWVIEAMRCDWTKHPQQARNGGKKLATPAESFIRKGTTSA